MAVSYTHLDVYKRQLYAGALKAQAVHAAAIFSYGERAARYNHFAA